MHSIQDIIEALIADFHSQRIDVCYWKASTGLLRAMQDPSKDIDLLVSRVDASVLVRHGFKRFRSEVRFDLPGVTNWVAKFGDYLCHVHLHESIYTGATNPLAFRIPWHEELLACAVTTSTNIPTLAPAAEAAVLLARFGHESKITCDIVRAAIELASTDVVLALLEKWTGRDVPRTLLTHPTRTVANRFFSHVLVEQCDPSASNRTHRRRHWNGVARRAYSIVRPDIAPELRPIYRGLKRLDRGLLISVVGADGAGKSTLAKRLTTWLSTWFDAQSIYLGHGDWVTDSWQTLAKLKWSAKGGAPIQTESTDDSQRSVGQADVILRYRRTVGARGIVRSTARVALADRKRRDGSWIRRRVRDGGIVVTDRLPLDHEQYGGVFPFEGLARPRVLLGQLETRVHERINIRPDIVFKLFVSPTVAVARKPDHNLAEVTQKVNAFDALEIDAAETMVVDTTKLSADEVFELVIAEVWKRL